MPSGAWIQYGEAEPRMLERWIDKEGKNRGEQERKVRRFVSTNGPTIFMLRYPHCLLSMRVAQFICAWY
jgi:hypothetical protein